MNLAASMQALPDLAAHPKVQRVMKHLPAILTALLVVLIAWQLARLTWLLVPTASRGPDPVISAPVAAPVNTKRINVQRIADAHLFGEATASDNPADAANAQQTQLPLVLAGVMASPEPTRGFAFIGESAAMAKFKRVGDPLPGGARLHSVYVDRVMLDRGGRLESLLLPRYSGATALPAPIVAAQPTRFSENVRRLAESNPAAFSEIVRPQPVFVGSVQKGYRVYPGRNRQQFARLGLQPGDLVTAVNGTALSDQTTGMQIFNTISTMDRVSLTIERNGQTQQITVNTAQIDLPDANSPATPLQDPSAPLRMPETAVQ